jgi:hypothetical protein
VVEDARSSARGRNARAAPFQPSAPAFKPQDPQQVSSEMQAYMAGMAQTWLTMSQGFNPMMNGMGMGMGVPGMGMPGFCPPFYPTPAYPVAQPPATDIPALLASMAIQGAEVPATKPAPKQESFEKKKELKARAELGASECALPLQTQTSQAPFSDVSNVLEANPSPNKSVSPVRRAHPLIDQENPQVA